MQNIAVGSIIDSGRDKGGGGTGRTDGNGKIKLGGKCKCMKRETVTV